jgi:recombination protein RecT
LGNKGGVGMSTNTGTSLSIVERAQSVIAPIEHDFSSVEGLRLNFQKELGFALLALNNSSSLANAALTNPNSLKAAVYNVALTGLSLNPVLREAYLIPRKGKVCLEPGYIGFIKILTDTGSVKRVWAHIVYSNEVFEPQYGTNPKIIHIPMMDTVKRGKVLAVYACAELANGTTQFEIMTESEVLTIKARSEAVKYALKDGSKTIWDTDEGEMFRKTAIRRLFKYLPKTEIPQSTLNALDVFDENNELEAANPNDPAANIRAARLNSGANKQLPSSNPVESEIPTSYPPVEDEKERLIREAIEKGEQKIAKYSTTEELNDIHVTISNLQNPVVKDALIAALLDRSNELGFDFDSGTEKFVEITDKPITEAPENDIPVPPPAMVAPPPRVNMAAVMEQREQSKKVPDFSF